jgi:heme exporter protein B
MPENGHLPLLRATLGVIGKDLLLEWRGRARVNATLFFAMMTLLLFSFAVGPEGNALARNAGGYLWLAILLASVMALGESFRIETENLSLEGLRLLPVSPRAIFLGKALSNTLFLFALAVLLFPLAVAIYGAHVAGNLGQAALVLLLGCAAISAPGTVYAAIAAQARARDVLLPLLLFPVLVPALVGAVKAMVLVLRGDPMGQLSSWLVLLAVFNVIYWAIGFVLFGRVIEE